MLKGLFFREPIAIITVILILRLVFIFIMGPMPQDAYYFFYSQHPALSYFDHPPMIAIVLRLFTTIFGKNVIALKLAGSFVTIITVFLFHLAAKCLLGIKDSDSSYFHYSCISCLQLNYYFILSLFILMIRSMDGKNWQNKLHN